MIQLDLPWPVTVLVVTSIASGAVYGLWKWPFGPLYRGLRALARMAGTMADIATEFQSDSGGSLRDAINRLEEGAGFARATAEAAKLTAERIAAQGEEDHTAIMKALEKLEPLYP